jgi:hypothetical protein
VTLANSSGLTGERIGFLLSEVYLPRFGVLDPRILRSLSWVKRPIDGQPRAAGLLGFRAAALPSVGTDKERSF